MMARLFPRQLDNSYRGHAAALWLMGVLVLMKLAMGINAVCNTYYVATAIDKIPLAAFGATGEQAAIGLFALVGLGNLLLGLIGVVVLWRYRSALPAFCVLVMFEQIAKHVLGALRPIGASEGTPVPILGVVFALILVTSLTLSLWRRDNIRQ